MIALQGICWRAAVIGRWLARVVGVSIFFIFLLFVFGEGLPNPFNMNLVALVQLLGVLALFVGLAVAWKWEGLGALVTIAGFALLIGAGKDHFRMLAFGVPAIVGVVHLASWGKLRQGIPAGVSPWRVPRHFVHFLLALIGVFLLLSVNEVLGQPPIMTPALHPGLNLQGAWHGTLIQGRAGSQQVDLIVDSEGLVSGSVGDASVAAGRIVNGRSWFGRLLHVNAPYFVSGKLSSTVRISEQIYGDRFTLPLRALGRDLDGSLFIRDRPTHLRLSRKFEEHP